MNHQPKDAAFTNFNTNDALIGAWRTAETPFTRNNYYGRLKSEGAKQNFSHIWRDSPLLIKAPHGVYHAGVSRRLRVECGTGGLALLMAETAGASAMVRDAACFHKPLKSYFAEIDRGLAAAAARGVVRLIDLHGCRDREGYDVAIGLGAPPVPAEAWRWGERAAAVFMDFGLTPMLQGHALRGAGDNTTVSKSRAHPCLAAVQIEMTVRTRMTASGVVGPMAPAAARALLQIAEEMARTP